MTRLALILALFASPVWACGDPCNPPKPEPPRVERVERSDPALPFSKPLPCCVRNGTVEFKAPWPSAASKARTRLICETAVRDGATIRPCTRQGAR